MGRPSNDERTYLLVDGVPVAEDCPSSDEACNECIEGALRLACCPRSRHALSLQEQDRLVDGDELCEVQGMLLCRSEDEL